MNRLKVFYTNLLSIIIISCVGIIVYSNSYYCSFHFDDYPSIVDNVCIRNIYHLQNIWYFLPRRFISYLSIAFNYHFNGLNVLGYHLFNLGVHLGAAILVWWLTLLTFSTPAMKEERITRHANSIALFVGLVFVSHPVQIEAVTYIVQRAASMATLFYLASLSLYVESRLLLDKEPTSGHLKLYYICSLIAAIVAMFTKEPAITLPLMILFYEFSFLKTKQNFNWKYLSPFLLTIFIIPVTMLLTETGAARLHQLRSEPGISSMHYLLTEFRVMVTYIRLIFLPLNQNLVYNYPISKSILELPTLFSFLFLIMVLFVAKRLFPKYRLVSFSIFWFFLTLLPESSILPIKAVIFEHRLYLPLVGYSIFLVSGVYYGTDLICRHSDPRSFTSFRMTIVILTMIIACYSALTYQRNKVWKDDFILWNDVLQKAPQQLTPYTNLGIAYYKQGDFTKAISDYNKVIELDPKYADAYYNRGNAYYKQGNFVQAISDYNEAIVLAPHDEDAYNNRGLAYSKQGNFIQAISDYNKAIALNPKDTDAYHNRAFIFYKLKKHGSRYSTSNNATP